MYGQPQEYHFYTWLDETLRDLLNVAKTVIPVANRKDARVVFYHVYQDTSGRFKKKEVGTVHSVKRGREDSMTLRAFRFQIGDMLDLAIMTTPERSGNERSDSNRHNQGSRR